MQWQWKGSMSGRHKRERESAGHWPHSSQAISCNARGDSTLAKRLSGFTLTWLPPVRAPNRAWEHALSSEAQLRPQNTEASQAHRPKRQGVGSESCDLAAACPTCTCLVIQPCHRHALHSQHSHLLHTCWWKSNNLCLCVSDHPRPMFGFHCEKTKSLSGSISKRTP